MLPGDRVMESGKKNNNNKQAKKYFSFRVKYRLKNKCGIAKHPTLF